MPGDPLTKKKNENIVNEGEMWLVTRDYMSKISLFIHFYRSFLV